MVTLTERIPGFTQLDDTTSFHQAAAVDHADGHVAALEDRQPDLLVFCAWMSAAPKHIAKYIAGYQKMFPNSAILLVEARLQDIFLGNSFPAACKIIRSYIITKRPLAYRGPSIILHACSNGGGNTVANIAATLRSQGFTAPFDTVTLDCSPGTGELHSAANAIRYSLPPNALLRSTGTVFVYLLMASYISYIRISGRKDAITWIRETFNDKTLLGVNVPRLYLYSRADLLVEAGDIHEHADDARRKGCGEVVEEVFDKAPHCALINEDAGRYWDAVEEHVRTQRKPFGESSWA